MVRLTQKDASGSWRVRGIPWEKLKEGERITKETSQILYMCLCKLKDYEDIGMNPDQLESRRYELEDMVMRICDKLCRHPRETAVQEELDTICESCPVSACLGRVFSAKPGDGENVAHR